MMNLELANTNPQQNKRVTPRPMAIPGGMVGFAPAYHNSETGEILLSSFANGTPAPVHLLEGLPANWFTVKNAHPTPGLLRESVRSGYTRDNVFYTREEATALANQERAERLSGSAYYDAF